MERPNDFPGATMEQEDEQNKRDGNLERIQTMWVARQINKE